MGGRSLGDRQDRIIGGFRHDGALALREPRVLALSPTFEFLRRGKAKIVSGCYATRQGTHKVVTWACRVGILKMRGGSPGGNGQLYLFIPHMETATNLLHIEMLCQIPVSK